MLIPLRLVSFRKFDLKAFIEVIGTFDWEKNFCEPNPDQAWDAFKKVFIPVCDKYAPYRSERSEDICLPG